jgi:hypothetical protein
MVDLPDRHWTADIVTARSYAQLLCAKKLTATTRNLSLIETIKSSLDGFSAWRPKSQANAVRLYSTNCFRKRNFLLRQVMLTDSVINDGLYRRGEA